MSSSGGGVVSGWLPHPSAIRFMILAMLVCGSTPLSGQAVEGVLVDTQSGRTISGALLSLIDSAGVVHDTSSTNRLGRFQLNGRVHGIYVISTRREAYASILSDEIALEDGVTVSYRLEVPPLSLRNMQQISETLDRSERLRAGAPGLCRGRMHPEEGGILLGVVREERTGEPLGGAVVSVGAPEGGRVGEVSTAVTDKYGTYVLCFVPAGVKIPVSVDAPDFRPSSQGVEVRRGTLSWYDFHLVRQDRRR